MSSAIDVQVLKNGDPYVHKFVRISIGEIFFPGGSQGVYGDEAWTDDDGHARFDVPGYDDYHDKYVWIVVSGERYGPWDLVDDGGYTVDVGTGSSSDDDE